jgi:nucleotide-binding universal stress UspA family protein
MGRIVVGVDGSGDSMAALRWAVDEASRTGDEIRAVYTYGHSDEHNPFLATFSSFASGSTAQQTAEQAQKWQEEKDADFHRQAAAVISGMVGEATQDHPEVKVVPVAVPGGRPSRALLREAGNCSLLVVGARGKGGFRGLRLGSVAEKCVRHAPCTVMVVRATA